MTTYETNPMEVLLQTNKKSHLKEKFDVCRVNINSIEQLAELPAEFLSGNVTRPLLSRDVNGNQYHHYLKPMLNSAMFILLVEFLQLFCFYGVSHTQTAFCEGAYSNVSGGWSPNMSTSAALGLTSLKQGLVSTYPFIG